MNIRHDDKRYGIVMKMITKVAPILMAIITGLFIMMGCRDDNDIVNDDVTCGLDITFTYRGEKVSYGTIERGGLCWMDRNLGADPLPFVPAEDATGNTDERLYGDLFQWGRLDDGHQDRQSNITAGLSNGDVPGHGDFNLIYDCRDPGFSTKSKTLKVLLGISKTD